MRLTSILLFMALMPATANVMAAAYDSYLECQIRERTTYISLGPNERATRVQRFLLCINVTRATTFSHIFTVGPGAGGSHSPKELSELSCSALDTKLGDASTALGIIETQITQLTEARTSTDEAYYAATTAEEELERPYREDARKCDQATDDLQAFVQFSVNSHCLRLRGQARMDCVDAQIESGPGAALQATAAQKCQVASESKANYDRAKAVSQEAANQIAALSSKISSLKLEAGKLRVQKERLQKARADKNCPRSKGSTQ